MMLNFYQKGLAAGRAGKPASDNPGKRFETRTAWDDGWRRGSQEKQS